LWRISIAKHRRDESDATMDAYIDFLDKTIKVVGYSKYKENWMTRPFSEWCTYTDEAFLMLCMATYTRKWEHEWRVEKYGQPRNLDQVDPARFESLYTAASQGTKRSWSLEGMERFNTLMINVFRDRKNNGRLFDEMVLEEMKQKYAKVNIRQQNNEELGDDARAPRPQQTFVYNDFHLELLVVHADAGVQQQQEMDGADDNANMIAL
jgi:hypothetical protein